MNEQTSSLARMAQRARTRPAFLASLLAMYQEQKKLTDQQVAEFLEGDTEALIHLALCMRPRSAPNFRLDVERIARHVHVNPLKLIKLIRTAESLEDMQQAQGHTSLLAARDYEDAEEDRS